jgi:aspartate/methionine/tyrosine aminotransferase
MAASSAPRVHRWNGDVSARDGAAFGAPAWSAALQPLCCRAMGSVDLDSPRGALREVPFMGVIYVVHEAMQLGYQNGHPDWSNLGQGQPEVGPMRGAPPRFDSVTIEPQDHAYGPLEGIPELRAAVAAHYNRLYRRGKKSQYTASNVAIAQGGRLALTRAMATVGAVNIGYQLPDYTAYEDMFATHLARLATVPVRTREEDGFRLSSSQFEQALEQQGLAAFLVSNPCNPTGNVIAGGELDRMVAIARRRRCTLLLDEFYSHFIYDVGSDGTARPGAGPVSGAEFVDDVERDPVLLFDGLTKSFRYPGWRVGWIVGPSAMVETMARAASAIDGGPSRWAQRAALQVLEPERADQETHALRDVFCHKRNVMVQRLQKLGVTFAAAPASTLGKLPAPFDDAMHFFRQALAHKVLTVPGQFFDVNPGGFRKGRSPYAQWMRFSFGPPLDNMQQGLDRLARMLGREAGR